MKLLVFCVLLTIQCFCHAEEYPEIPDGPTATCNMKDAGGTIITSTEGRCLGCFRSCKRDVEGCVAYEWHGQTSQVTADATAFCNSVVPSPYKYPEPSEDDPQAFCELLNANNDYLVPVASGTCLDCFRSCRRDVQGCTTFKWNGQSSSVTTADPLTFCNSVAVPSPYQYPEPSEDDPQAACEMLNAKDELIAITEGTCLNCFRSCRQDVHSCITFKWNGQPSSVTTADPLAFCNAAERTSSPFPYPEPSDNHPSSWCTMFTADMYVIKETEGRCLDCFRSCRRDVPKCINYEWNGQTASVTRDAREFCASVGGMPSPYNYPEAPPGAHRAWCQMEDKDGWQIKRTRGPCLECFRSCHRDVEGCVTWTWNDKAASVTVDPVAFCQSVPVPPSPDQTSPEDFRRRNMLSYYTTVDNSR